MDRPIQTFISYCRQDQSFHDELVKRLTVLERQGLLAPWHDQCIVAGDDWKQRIEEETERADIVLLLVSPDFLHSSYCFDVEMKRALERHQASAARVIPIIARYCNWQDTPLGALQALPRDGKPIKSWLDNDEAWFDVIENLRKIALSIRSRDRFPENKGLSPPQNDLPSAQRPVPHDSELAPRSRLAEAHYVCQEGLNLRDRGDGTFVTGRWVMDPAHAQPGLVFCLHVSKSTSSYRQGVVEKVMKVEESTTTSGRTQRRVTLLVRATPNPLPWAGEGSGERGYKWAK